MLEHGRGREITRHSASKQATQFYKSALQLQRIKTFTIANSYIGIAYHIHPLPLNMHPEPFHAILYILILQWNPKNYKNM